MSATIDPAQLQSRIDALGAIGRGADGGIYRLVYTPAWIAARDLVEDWMHAGGLTTWTDAAGNLIGRLEGSDAGPVVMTGSHIDAVPCGGAYDGALGVHASLAAVLALQAAHGRPRRSIDVVAICDEEGSRFRSDFLGARAITGELTPAELDRLIDADGITAAEAMAKVGLDPTRIGEARRDDVAAWLELHIEQGGTLEAEGIDLGVVHTITGHRIVRVTLEGRQDHAGTTPMDVRRDPMQAAAEIITRAIEIAREMGRPSVCTCGFLAAEPGAANVVPSTVQFTLDMRDAGATRLAALAGGVDRAIAEVSARHGVTATIAEAVERTPVPLSADLQSLLARHASEAGFSHTSMPSMAGHDTEVMVERWPAAMIFVPSRDGRSHTPAEFTPVEQALPGIQVLAAALQELAY